MTLSVMVQVTHLLGGGHLTRAAALAQACVRRGHRVALLSGGMPNALTRQEGFDLVQLPPVRIEGTAFTRLLTPEGGPADAEYLAERRRVTLAEIAARQPDVLVTELFPFGRRVLAEEFLSAIAAARAGKRAATVLSSVRDILAAPSRPERARETVARIKALYDGVLVHGDLSLVPLEASWPVDGLLQPLLHYTGYIDNPPSQGDGVGDRTADDIVVSGGFSAASLPLYRSAIEAARVVGRSWRILVGGGVGAEDFAALCAVAPVNAVVERARLGFRSLLAKAALSISQCGYNTALDVLGLPLRRLFVPFETGSETEQLLRAETLAARGLAMVLRERELSPATLAAAVEASLLMEAPRAAAIQLDGGAVSAELIESLHERKRQ